MSELESLALLIADLNTQVRVLQEENAQLREELQAERDRDRQREESETPSES